MTQYKVCFGRRYFVERPGPGQAPEVRASAQEKRRDSGWVRNDAAKERKSDAWKNEKQCWLEKKWRVNGIPKLQITVRLKRKFF